MKPLFSSPVRTVFAAFLIGSSILAQFTHLAANREPHMARIYTTVNAPLDAAPPMATCGSSGTGATASDSSGPNP